MDRINSSKILSQQVKLVLGILSNESMTAKALMECLMDEPYSLTRDEVLDALIVLRNRDLLQIKAFVINSNGFDIDTRLTFAYDWVSKL